MFLLGWILIFSFFGSVFCLIGGIFLLWRQKLAKRITTYLISFAAGSLLGAAFLHMLPEVVDKASGKILIYTLIGILVMFLLEKFLLWYHCHNRKCPVHGFTYTILIGDGVHNFIDGIIIGASFLISIPLGIITALAVAVHEVPQEIGDFGVLIHAGWKRKKVLLYNLLAALATPIAAILVYFFSSFFDKALIPLIAFAAGNFIYIASSDLIPEIHKHYSPVKAILQSLCLGSGILLIWLIERILG